MGSLVAPYYISSTFQENFMLDCLILGDSIAVGTHQFKQECVAYAKGGINSQQYNKQYVNSIKENYYVD